MQNKDFQSLFQAEEEDLLKDLRSLPVNAATRKINEMIKRARVLRTHALILNRLKSQMPYFVGKEVKQDELIDNLEATFNEVSASCFESRHLSSRKTPHCFRFAIDIEFHWETFQTCLNTKSSCE